MMYSQEPSAPLPYIERQSLLYDNIGLKLAAGALVTASLVMSGLATEAAHANSDTPVEIVAHRGGTYGFNKHYTENSLRGVRQVGHLAAEANTHARSSHDGAAEMITDEGDLYPSTTKRADGSHVWVVMHDSTLNRTSNGTGAVSSHNIHYLHRKHLNDGEHIPTFTQELTAAAKTQAHLELEIKPGNVSATDLAYLDNMVKRQGLESRFTFSSVHQGDLRKLEKIDPAVRKGYIVSHRIAPESIKEFADIVLYEHHAATAKSVAAAHRAGMRVETWTINSPAEWKQALRHHVDGIVTDSSKLLYGWLKKHGRN